MIFVVAVLLTVSGLFLTYVAVGLARTAEKKRGFLECEQRLEVVRRQLRRRGVG